MGGFFSQFYKLPYSHYNYHYNYNYHYSFLQLTARDCAIKQSVLILCLIDQIPFELGLLISHALHFQVFNAIDNLKATRATHSVLGLQRIFMNLEWEIWERIILAPILLLMRLQWWIVHDNFSLTQTNHMFRIILISHYLDICFFISYFSYL